MPVMDVSLQDQITQQQGTRRSRLGMGKSRHAATKLLVACLGVIALFAGRVGYMQIIQGDVYTAQAKRNQFREHVVLPSRGTIFDHHGIVLASNEPSFELTLTIADLPKDETERSNTIQRASDLAGINRTDIDLLISRFARRPTDAIPVVTHIPYERAILLGTQTAQLSGFRLETLTRRTYHSTIPSLSHVLGYVASISPEELETYADRGYRPIDNIGKQGVERTAEEVLRGTPGTTVYEVNAQGRELSIVSQNDPVPGSDVILAIDAAFQSYIEQTLREAFETTGASRASVVAIDPTSGAVRALVSLPGYDNNAFVRGIDQELYSTWLEDPDRPLFPRAVSGEYPSGSTFKPFVAYAALAEGVISEHTSFVSNGGIRILEWFFPDWKYGGHGVTDVRKAIAESVNTFFYIIGGGYDSFTGLGVKRITDYARQFGFGEPTGIDLPNEADGFLPSKEWKEEVKQERWYVGDTYHVAIGQGDLLATPIQLAAATAAIANGGSRITPYVIEGIDGVAPPSFFTSLQGTPVAHESFDQDAIQIVREGMRQTVTQGSARSLSLLNMDVAGKTGTAQTPGDRPTHAWFTGFGPYESPELAIAILVEEGGEGSSVAVPIAGKLFDWWDKQR